MHWDLLEVLTACGPAAEDAAASAGAASLLGKLQSTAQDAKMFNNFGNQLGAPGMSTDVHTDNKLNSAQGAAGWHSSCQTCVLLLRLTAGSLPQSLHSDTVLAET